MMAGVHASLFGGLFGVISLILFAIALLHFEEAKLLRLLRDRSTPNNPMRKSWSNQESQVSCSGTMWYLGGWVLIILAISLLFAGRNAFVGLEALTIDNLIAVIIAIVVGFIMLW